MDRQEQETWDLRTEEIIQGFEWMLAAGSDYDFMRNVAPGIIRTEARQRFNYSEAEMAEKFGDLESLVDIAKARIDAQQSD